MMGVGAPMQWWLQEFGEVCHAYWDAVAYHVGSSLEQKDGWRDVDVRVMLDDEDYAREFGDPARQYQNPKWVAATLAWSALGKQMTGLPIDFQVQQRTGANTEYPKHRNALLRYHAHAIFGTGVKLDAELPPPPVQDAPPDGEPLLIDGWTPRYVLDEAISMVAQAGNQNLANRLGELHNRIEGKTLWASQPPAVQDALTTISGMFDDLINALNKAPRTGASSHTLMMPREYVSSAIYTFRAEVEAALRRKAGEQP